MGEDGEKEKIKYGKLIDTGEEVKEIYDDEHYKKIKEEKNK